MKISDVTHAPIYNIQAVSAAKNESAKTTDDAKKTANQRDVKEAKDVEGAKGEIEKKITPEQVSPLESSESKEVPINTKILFSVERDLNLIVTRVMDSTSNKVIRQIPTEETIKRLKLKYQQSLAKKETLTNDVIV